MAEAMAASRKAAFLATREAWLAAPVRMMGAGCGEAVELTIGTLPDRARRSRLMGLFSYPKTRVRDFTCLFVRRPCGTVQPA